MARGGLPCRVHICREVFAVADGDSMHQLMDARERRNAHEIEAHDYHHVLVVEPTTDVLRTLTALRLQRATRR